MTSSQNVDRVRAIYAEWERGNMSAGPEVFDPELVFEAFLPEATERVTVKGLLEVEMFMREFLRQWRDYRLFGDEFRAIGSDAVVVLGHQTASGRQSGATVEHPMSSAWRFRDDKVVHLVFDPDPRKVFAVAGVAE
ncbi:MAG TPA: nuclear transport factor 2 family protein [Thermoleophilaceae bacterium]